MREWKKSYPYIKKNIIEKYNPDVYISSYDHNLDHIRQYEEDGMEYIDDRENDTEVIDVKEVLEYYHPKKYIFRKNCYTLDFKFNSIINERLDKEWSKRNIQGWYTTYLSLDLVNLKDYDYIIRIIPDISIKNFNLKFDKKIVLPNLCIDPGPCSIQEGLHPHIAYGTSNFMKKYLEIYTKLQDMHSKGLTDISVREMTIKDYIRNYIGTENIFIDEEIEWKYHDTDWSTEMKKMHNLILLDNPNGWYNEGRIDQENYDIIMNAIEKDELIPDDAYNDPQIKLF